MLYGLRRGEVLGLRWQDVDFPRGTLNIRQQVQRVGRMLYQGPVKTKAGERDLPLVDLARSVLLDRRMAQVRQRANAKGDWVGCAPGEGLVFTSRNGRPVEPRSLARTFQKICEQHSIRVITVHHVRHTAATFLKAAQVPARDAQLILGHSQISITQQIYQHDDLDSRREALNRVEKLLLPSGDRGRCRQNSRQAGSEQQKRGSDEPLHLWSLWLRGQDSNLRPRGYELDKASLCERLTEVNRVLHDRRRQWTLGVVAVNYCRQNVNGMCYAEDI